MNKKSGIENPNVVDLITENPITSEIALIMIENQPWAGDARRLQLLQDKVNGYLSFVLDGGLKEKFPDMMGKKVRFQLDCAEPPW